MTGVTSDHYPGEKPGQVVYRDEDITLRRELFCFDLIKTVKENIKFVQSDQNGVIWHLEPS